MNLNATLTKENFWDRMTKEYPNATKAFCDWIDEYKKSVNWDSLFNAEIPYQQKIVGGESFLSFTKAPKFHDLPHAMQLGIWMAYVCQRGGCQYEIEDFFAFDLAEEIEQYFQHVLEPELTI